MMVVMVRLMEVVMVMMMVMVVVMVMVMMLMVVTVRVMEVVMVTVMAMVMVLMVTVVTVTVMVMMKEGQSRKCCSTENIRYPEGAKALGFLDALPQRAFWGFYLVLQLVPSFPRMFSEGGIGHPV